MTDLKILVAELAEIFKRPLDYPFSVMLTSSAIGYRATILKQEFDKNGRYPLGSEDNIILPLKRVSAIECCCADDLECQVNRTRDRVPSPVRGNFKPDPFLYVGESNGSKAFTYAQPHIIENILTGSKFLKNDAFYSFYNGFLYTFNFEGGKLGIRDVFSNGQELIDAKDCNGKPCIDTIYIEDDMKKVIKQMIMEEFKSDERADDEAVEINE